MSEQDVEIIRSGYEKFNSGDIEGTMANFDEEIEWTEPGGGNAPSGTFKGHQQVVEGVFAKVGESFEEFAPNPDNFDDQGDKIVVTGRVQGKQKSGAELDVPFTHTWEMKDGKVTSFAAEMDEESWAAAWS